jgi:hypothetical protein
VSWRLRRHETGVGKIRQGISAVQAPMVFKENRRFTRGAMERIHFIARAAHNSAMTLSSSCG